MACERIPVKDFNKDANCTNCIYDIVKRILQQQKEAQFASECDTCDSPLFAQIYNTRPVIFYLANGARFEVLLPGTQNPNDTTDMFRIEFLRGDCVTLRLIRRQGQTLICTDFTAVLNLCCVCGIQCLPPICCEECGRGCTVNNAA